MSIILDQFRAISAKRYQVLKNMRQSQKMEIIGCVPMHFPEELIAAAGAFPLILLEGDQPITWGHQHTFPFFCGYTRSNIDLAVKEELNFLDGLVVLDTCLQMRGLWAVLSERLSLPFMKFIQFPAAIGQPYAETMIMNELTELKRDLEEFFGHGIDDESIWQTIQAYNENRSLMRQVYRMRLSKPGLMSAKDMVSIITASMLMAKEQHSSLLKKLISQLKMIDLEQNAIKLFISGHLCCAPQDDILELIESFGTSVVDDDLYTGRQYFSTDVPTDDDPLKSLARKYLDRKSACPTLWDLENNYADYLVDAVKASQAQGVVILLVKFCEPHMFSYPEVKKTLSYAGIPHLLIETEHEMLSIEQVKTRLQAFVEVLRSGA